MLNPSLLGALRAHHCTPQVQAAFCRPSPPSRTSGATRWHRTWRSTTSSCGRKGGEYPIFKSLKVVYCKEYTAERNEHSALLHRNLGPSDEVVRAVAKDLLFGHENGAGDSTGLAYLLALRASPDHRGITADRQLQNACMDVRPPAFTK